MKGDAETPSGVKYSYESVNTIPGRAPVSMWVAMGIDESALVALVGIAPVVERFVRRASRLVGQPLPVCELNFDNVPEAKGCVYLAGVFPEARAREITEDIAPPGSGYGYWAKKYAEYHRDPQRIDPDKDTEIVSELWAMFIQQCEASIAAGRN